MNALIGSCQQVLEMQFARRASETARIRNAKQLHGCIVHKLEHVVAIECKNGRMHHLEDASQQSRRLKRTHPLLLEQVRKGINLGGELTERIGGIGAASPKRVIAFSQRGNDVGKRLQGADQPLDQRTRDQGQINQQAAGKQNGWGSRDLVLVDQDRKKGECRQRQKQAVQPGSAYSGAPARAPAPIRSCRIIGHTSRCGDIVPRGSSPKPPQPAKCSRRNGAEPCESAAIPPRQCSYCQKKASTDGPELPPGSTAQFLLHGREAPRAPPHVPARARFPATDTASSAASQRQRNWSPASDNENDCAPENAPQAEEYPRGARAERANESRRC